VATKQTAQAVRPSLEVHMDAPELGARMHIGWLYPADVRVDLAPSFEYTPQWLASGRCFMLDPRLDL
jgi:serine/threonine-protein kinase HipA